MGLVPITDLHDTYLQDQSKGKPELNFDPGKEAVKAPLLLWGPYLWADGVKGRRTDELVWKREDIGPDGTHPSPSGRQKVAAQLLQFFKTADGKARRVAVKHTVKKRALFHLCGGFQGQRPGSKLA